MSSENNELHDENELEEIKLDTIPDELFLYICSFLPSKYLITVVSHVCTKFKCIFEDNATWKIRLRDRFPNQHLIIDYTDVDWAEVCIAREEHYRLWHDKEANLKHLHIRNAHNGAVDVVHIFNNGSLCASGSRDRDIKLWNLKTLSDHEMESSHIQESSHMINAHEGWIWSMAYSSHFQKLYSGSWDSLIKGWDPEKMDSSSEFISFRVKAPVLCLALSEELLVSGSYDRLVNAFDQRAGIRPVFKYLNHRKPVLCLAANEKYLISGSEDQSLIVYDIVARKVYKTLEFDASYPFSISFDKYNLWMGDSKGFIHLIDSCHETFDLLKSFASGHEKRVTGIHHSLGSIITCSSDKSIRVLAPCVNPQTIATVVCNTEIAGISAFSDTLVSANSDESISLWTPKSE